MIIFKVNYFENSLSLLVEVMGSHQEGFHRNLKWIFIEMF